VSPGARVWGARRHMVGPVQQVHRAFTKGEFDSVILNGVFGFGVNTIPEMNQTIESVKRILRSGGLLLLGWNTDLTADPLTLDEMRRGFRPAVDLPFPPHREFAGESHVYDFQLLESRGDVR
jgi:SAM-dependent methyltransferase